MKDGATNERSKDGATHQLIGFGGLLVKFRSIYLALETVGCLDLVSTVRRQTLKIPIIVTDWNRLFPNVL